MSNPTPTLTHTLTDAAAAKEAERLLCGRRLSARALLEEMGVSTSQGYLALDMNSVHCADTSAESSETAAAVTLKSGADPRPSLKPTLSDILAG